MFCESDIDRLRRFIKAAAKDCYPEYKGLIDPDSAMKAAAALWTLDWSSQSKNVISSLFNHWLASTQENKFYREVLAATDRALNKTRATYSKSVFQETWLSDVFSSRVPNAAEVAEVLQSLRKEPSSHSKSARNRMLKESVLRNERHPLEIDRPDGDYIVNGAPDGRIGQHLVEQKSAGGPRVRDHQKHYHDWIKERFGVEVIIDFVDYDGVHHYFPNYREYEKACVSKQKAAPKPFKQPKQLKRRRRRRMQELVQC